MKKHILPIVIALLTGLLGFIIFFIFGSISGRGEVGLVATCILYLYICKFLVRKHPSSWWYIGFVINIPIWSLLIFWAEAGQFKLYFWGLITLLIISYTGSFIGLWLFEKMIKLSKIVKVLLIAIPLVIIVSVTYIMNGPKPIPNDKLSFVGLWNCSKFELKIMPDGKAVINQNEYDRGFEYEHLNIKVAPSHITDLNVDFRGDSILIVRRHSYYAREFRIDKYPYMDSNNYKMVLNGAILIKK